MKTPIIILLSLLWLTGREQITTGISIGYAFKTIEPVISPNISFAYHGFALTPEMKVHIRQDEPGSFGLKFSYEYKFIQAGYGRYFDLYSLDKYDEYRNGWSNLYFVSVHYKIAFIEYDWHNQSILSLGVRYALSMK